MNINMNNGRVSVNGKVYHGSSISITNGKVIVDVKVQERKLKEVINVVVKGDVRCRKVGGSVSTMSGDITH